MICKKKLRKLKRMELQEQFKRKNIKENSLLKLTRLMNFYFRMILII